jgi:hypothetical protein
MGDAPLLFQMNALLQQRHQQQQQQDPTLLLQGLLTLMDQVCVKENDQTAETDMM